MPGLQLGVQPCDPDVLWTHREHTVPAGFSGRTHGYIILQGLSLHSKFSKQNTGFRVFMHTLFLLVSAPLHSPTFLPVPLPSPHSLFSAFTPPLSYPTQPGVRSLSSASPSSPLEAIFTRLPCSPTTNKIPFLAPGPELLTQRLDLSLSSSRRSH